MQTVYQFLWTLAASGTLFAYIDSHPQLLTARKFPDILALVFTVLTIFQLITVYKDMHGIEEGLHKNSDNEDYPGFLNTRLDRFLRYAIIVFLLFGVGKISEALYPFAEHIQREKIMNATTEFLRPQDKTKHFSHSLFVIGSFLLFLSLFLWNISALRFRYLKLKILADGDTKKLVVTVRIALFTLSSLFAFLYWFCVFIGISGESTIVPYFIGLYSISSILYLFFRHKMSQQLQQAHP